MSSDLASMTREIEQLQTPEGIEEAAREVIGYVQRGEIRLTVLPGTEAPTVLPSGWPYDQMAQVVAVRSAEAGAVASARNYDAMKDATLEEVTDLFARTNSHQQMLTLFEEDILPKARQTLQVSSQAYNVGEVDFLQLIDNWRQLLRYEVNYRRLEANLRQSLADLEQAVGGWTAMSSITPPAPEIPPIPERNGDEAVIPNNE